MGLTIDDRNRIMYNRYRNKGLSHDEAIEKFPEQIRDNVIKSLTMTGIESHFGVSDKTFKIVMGSIVGLGIIGIILAIILI